MQPTLNTLRPLLVVLALTLSLVSHAQSVWTRVEIGPMSLELPKNWTALSGNERMTLDAYVEALRVEPAGKLDFAANLYDSEGKVVALANVRLYPDQALTQRDVSALSAADVREYDSVTRESVYATLPKGNMRVARWRGTRVESVAGKFVMVVEYDRQSNGSPDLYHVRLMRVHDASRSFTLTLSYRERGGALYGPIVEHIATSLRFR